MSGGFVVVVAVCVLTVQCATVKRNAQLNPYAGYAPAPGPDFVAIYPTGNQNRKPSDNQPGFNSHPNVPFSALKDAQLPSQQNQNQANAQHNPYAGYAPAPGPDFVAIYPTGNHKRSSEKSNTYPNVPLSAVMDLESQQYQNQANAQHNPYAGYAPAPDADFIAISPPRKQTRQTEERSDTDQAGNPFDFSNMENINETTFHNPSGNPFDFSKIMENMNQPFNFDQSGNPFDFSKMMENMSQPFSIDQSGNPFDFSKMMENMSQPFSIDQSGNPFDFSKMMENMSQPFSIDQSENPLDFSKIMENMNDYSKIMENMNDYSKMMENINQTTFNIPSENPFDFSKMMENMNLTNASVLGIDLSSNLSNIMEQLQQLNVYNGPMNYTTIDSSGYPDGMWSNLSKVEEAIIDEIEHMEERMDNIEKDVANLKNSSTQVSTDGCPEDFVRSQETGSCYFFSENQKSWSDALVACVREHGAYLVNIETPQENLFLKNTLSAKKAKDDFYIGGRMKGKTFRWSHTDDKVRYTNWGPGEPNTDVEVKERCMEIGFFNRFIGYHWRDVPCFFKKRYICEKPM